MDHSSPKSVITTATTVSNHRLCDEHYRLTLRLKNFPPSLPGHFVHLTSVHTPSFSRSYDDRDTLWNAGLRRGDTCDFTVRRAFSIAGRRQVSETLCELDVIFRVVGKATTWMSQLKEDDSIDLLGPLGNAFTIPEDAEHAVLVAGGVGIPPMFYLAEMLSNHGLPTVAFCGAQSRNFLAMDVVADASSSASPVACVREFSAFGVDTVITTDDGSLGFKGFVSDALEQYLASAAAPNRIVVYTCGPEPMMKAVGRICSGAGATCQACLERSMACGMGTCQSCVVPIRSDGKDQWHYELCCSDGPVFDFENVAWETC